jgi:hypothetical protein
MINVISNIETPQHKSASTRFATNMPTAIFAVNIFWYLVIFFVTGVNNFVDNFFNFFQILVKNGT